MSSEAGATAFYGDKYDALAASAAAIRTAGAATVPMIGFSQAELNQAAEVNGLPAIEEVGGLSEAQYEHVADAAQLAVPPDALLGKLCVTAMRLEGHFNGPIVLRSSGRGDAAGVGVYESSVHSSDPGATTQAFRRVFASYYSPAGRNYRERTGVGDGFGMVMQPMVGNLLPADPYRTNTDTFMPLVSGNIRYGTPRYPQGAIVMQRGFGSGVEGWHAVIDVSSEPGLRDRMSLQNLLSLMGGRVAAVGQNARSGNAPARVWSRNGPVWKEVHSQLADGYADRFPRAERVTLGALMTITRSLHESARAPQYLEFAVAGRKQDIYVVQKADLHTGNTGRVAEFDFADSRNVLADNMEVVGEAAGTEPFRHIVCIDGATDRDELYAFDNSEAADGGYLLAYTSRAASVECVDIRGLRNVRALADISFDYQHFRQVESHLVGYSDQVGIPLLMVRHASADMWHAFGGIQYNWPQRPDAQELPGRFTLLSGQFRVAAAPGSPRAAVVDLREQ